MTANQLATELVEFLLDGNDRLTVGPVNPFNGGQSGWGRKVLIDEIQRRIEAREAELLLQFGPRLTFMLPK